MKLSLIIKGLKTCLKLNLTVKLFTQVLVTNNILRILSGKTKSYVQITRRKILYWASISSCPNQSLHINPLKPDVHKNFTHT